MLLTSSWLERVEGGPEPGSMYPFGSRRSRGSRAHRIGIGDAELVARPLREAFSGGSRQGVEKGTPGEPISAPDP